MIIAGIDPGGTTGFCVVDTCAQTIKAWQFESHDEVAAQLFDLINSHNKDGLVVAVENFVGSGQRDVHIVATIELLGYIVQLCRLLGVRVVRQSPQYRRPFLIEALQRYRTHAHRHARDAYAHVLCYLLTKASDEEGGDLLETGRAKGPRSIDHKLQGLTRPLDSPFS